ncbi:MAG: glycosyltransferase family 39 protein [Candidatus Hydrogenedentes bacterium]|nr:glycosyltransferase family 39 protein [Candidatus Hydrogenedentota bacterium]
MSSGAVGRIERLLGSGFPGCALLMGIGLFIFHLVVNRQYGFHGDELYFLDCGLHPDWGYVDHPPFTPLVARVATSLFGINLFAFRFFPALSLALSCLLTGWLARRLGAGRIGEFLACFCFVMAPMITRVGAFLNIPSFELTFWLVAAHLLVTIEIRNGGRWWLAFGAVCGLALLNKHTTLFLGTGVAVGLIMTHRRRDLQTPWPWLGGVVALLIFLPNLVWQYRNDWATLEFVRNINAEVMDSRLVFVLGQFVLMNLLSWCVLGAGLIFYFRDPVGRRHRMLAWIFVVVLVVLLILRSKVYYLLPAYPLLYAGGAVWLEQRWIGFRGKVKRVALCAAMTGMWLLLLPIVAPIGTLEWKEAYSGRVLGDPTMLTFDFRFQIGRPEELATFKQICTGLTPEERDKAVILTGEYDSVSTIHLLGKDLPPAISGSNSHYLWGPQGNTADCMIVLGYEEEVLETCFGEIRRVGELPRRNEAKDGSTTRPIYLCKKPTAPLEELWPRLKRYR